MPSTRRSPLLEVPALQVLRNCRFRAFPENSANSVNSVVGTDPQRFIVPAEFVPDGQR